MLLIELDCYLWDTVRCYFILLSFVCMDLAISADVVVASCWISCWPGHWYLSQGLAHVHELYCQDLFPKAKPLSRERDKSYNSGGSETITRGDTGLLRIVRANRLFFPHM